MIHIDSLNIQLPWFMAQRAENISLLVAHQLAQLQLTMGTSIDVARLNLPPLSIHRSQSDKHIATTIANAIGETVLVANVSTTKPKMGSAAIPGGKS